MLTALILLSGCGGDDGSDGTTAPARTPTPATPVSYPIPEGCPSPAEFATASTGASRTYEGIDLTLLNTYLETPLPDRGCAFASTEVRSAESSSSTYRMVEVWYFNLEESNNPSWDDLALWAESAGGTEIDEVRWNFDLPESFSGWTGSWIANGLSDDGSWAWSEDAIPEYTQGKMASAWFGLDEEEVTSLIDAQESGVDPGDPTSFLANGAAIPLTGSIDAVNEEGYSWTIDLDGQMEPFISEVADSIPGEFTATTTVSYAGSATNTTPGRNADGAGARVIALYAAETDLCRTKLSNGALSSDEIFPSGDTSDHAPYCYVELGRPLSSPLAPEETQTFSSVDFGNHSDTQGITLEQLDEGSTALEDLNSPVSVYATPVFGNELSTSDSGVADSECEAEAWPSLTYSVVPLDGWPDVLCE
jgi:hypothetical protein